MILARHLAGLCLALLVAGCDSPRADRASRAGASDGELSVMTYNVRRYGLSDRDGDGQDNDPKPDEEIRALLDVITAEAPDVLALQEIGGPTFLEDLQARLAERGMAYKHSAFLPAPVGENANLAVLSRLPFSDIDPITDLDYAIGTNRIPVLRGFLAVDLVPQPGYHLRIINVHLKSRVYSSLGQTEMRRNEARLLNNVVRKALKDNPDLNLLVVGDFNDTIRSAALREAMGSDLRDLPAADAMGDTWTHAWAAEGTYSRIDYLLVSSGLEPEIVPSKVRAVRHARMLDGSDHRPLVAVLRTSDRPRPASTERGPASP